MSKGGEVMGSKRARKRAKQEARRRTRRAQRLAAGEPSSPASRETDPLIGYLAHNGPHYLCDGDGCIVAGSRRKLQEIIGRSGPAGARMDTIQTARFSEILAGMQLGGAYCLDEEAYGRFLEPGRRMGMPLTDEDFSDPGPLGMHFVRVQWLTNQPPP